MKSTRGLHVLCLLVLISCGSGKKIPPLNEPQTRQNLQGNWSLVDIQQDDQHVFDSLFRFKIPIIHFDTTTLSISGNSGCNSFSGTFRINGNEISFPEPFIMTKMYCPGGGETYFFNAIHRTDHFQIVQDSVLLLKDGGQMVMKYVAAPSHN